jgi:membrane-associated protease RseP (regulator of RpoE activity)
MKPYSALPQPAPSPRRSVRVLRAALGGAFLLAVVPLQAQTEDSIRVRVVRAVTPFEVQVERLARTLIARRNDAITLSNTRQQLLVALRKPDIQEGERLSVASSLRGLETRLANLEVERNMLRRALDDLCSERRQPAGWMGVNYTSNFSVTSTSGGVFMTHFKEYPAIESVEPNSPAERAGIQRGDILLSLGGRDLQDAGVVFGELLRPGSRLALKIKRGVDIKTVSVTIEPRPSDFQVPCAWVDETLTAAMSPAPGAFAGRLMAPGSARIVMRRDSLSPTRVEVVTGQGGFSYTLASPADWAAGARIVPLNEDLARLVSVDRGIFVVDVTSRSPAARSGLRGGDVIVSAEGRPMTSPLALRQMMEQASMKELRLEIVRMKKNETITLRW